MRYRNITPDTLQVPIGDRWVSVAPGDVLETPHGWEDTHYVQTGQCGETPLFAPLDTSPKKSPATADNPKE